MRRPESNVVYWSATSIELDENGEIAQEYENHTIYYAKTRDFRTFTDAQVYHSGGKMEDGTPIKVIDSTMIENDGTYYRYTKNEMNGTIMIDKSDAILGEFTTVESDTLSSEVPSTVGAVEGPDHLQDERQNRGWERAVVPDGGPLRERTGLLSADHYRP